MDGALPVNKLVRDELTLTNISSVPMAFTISSMCYSSSSHNIIIETTRGVIKPVLSFPPLKPPLIIK
jgi:hypothetical protein